MDAWCRQVSTDPLAFHGHLAHYVVGHNWVQGQGSGPRLKGDKDDEEDTYDAMGNKIENTKKKAKLSSAELRKKKKDRMARRKRGEEVFSDEDD